MKKILIRIVVLFLIFIGSVAGFAYIMDDETTIQTEDMKKATLPLVYMRYQDTDMNPLHGYVEPMEALTIRDTLTPISTDRDVSLHIQTFGVNVQDIYFEVPSPSEIDGKTIFDLSKQKNENPVNILEVISWLNHTHFCILLALLKEDGFFN